MEGIIAPHERGSGMIAWRPRRSPLGPGDAGVRRSSPRTAIGRQLPQAIADGIRYAADHGARIIDLPLDPGTLGLTSKGDPAAAGGSPAEQAAVGYALSKGVVLVAPAGDDGQGPGLVNYPAAYSGVIAVGAVGRTGQLASFSSRRSYTSLTAPGVSLVVATPPAGYRTISSTAPAAASSPARRPWSCAGSTAHRGPGDPDPDRRHQVTRSRPGRACLRCRPGR